MISIRGPIAYVPASKVMRPKPRAERQAAWTEEHVAVLIENWCKIPEREIAFRLGRSLISVKHKAARMNLSPELKQTRGRPRREVARRENEKCMGACNAE